VQLCCHYNSPKILNYLHTNVVGSSPNPRETRKDLLRPVCSEGGLKAVHLAAFFGNLQILRILNDIYDADFGEKSEKGLTPLHCAAQRKEGIVTIYFLKDNFKNFDPNAVDNHGGTPLHYAIMSIEEYNIHALMSLGSNINK
jgi:ankyrin repeat protein